MNLGYARGRFGIFFEARALKFGNRHQLGVKRYWFSLVKASKITRKTVAARLRLNTTPSSPSNGSVQPCPPAALPPPLPPPVARRLRPRPSLSLSFPRLDFCGAASSFRLRIARNHIRPPIVGWVKVCLYSYCCIVNGSLLFSHVQRRKKGRGEKSCNALVRSGNHCKIQGRIKNNRQLTTRVAPPQTR